MAEAKEYYECPVCSYATNSYGKFMAHGDSHLEPQEPSTRVKELFHTLWSKSVGTPGYDKTQWLELQKLLRC